MTTGTARPTLTVVVCGAGAAPDVFRLVELAQGRGWGVGVVATPAALAFLDMPKLEALTGSPVVSEHRRPGESRERSSSEADAVVVAPATFNTVCKLALGISDTYALSAVAEAIGRGVPVAVLPFVDAALAGRKPFVAAVESLRSEGVRVLFGPDQWEPHPPGTGGGRIDAFPWAAVLDAAGVWTVAGGGG
ncbi:flavoprotein [Phytohabitans suffuscus]|uniref:Flavoprotein n=1 Tax=Phytohabitans suffuscus TaxID=624315 RepID=A0A6F8YM22_9ACTN|nr:flavoprotein [Phytohabitans suffuscus]BCB86991.1 flavoprotein [Phytohabitans suffuscus]